MLASYVHLHFGSRPGLAQALVARSAAVDVATVTASARVRNRAPTIRAAAECCLCVSMLFPGLRRCSKGQGKGIWQRLCLGTLAVQLHSLRKETFC